MPDKIRMRRGNLANLPTLDDGEIGLAEDTKEVYIGSTAGNIKLSTIISGGHKVQSGSSTATVAVAGTQVSVTVPFPTAFSSAPKLFLQVTALGASSATYITLQGSATTTQLTIFANSGVAQVINFDWVAIGG